ncbi:FAD assembly factor SdhE [Alysiella filiformis]|uniref:FAD assembly factor SdhE n=1 Tax=Alysiella filiformis DSM 16848 TaxID=1120981 RepID=A0A286EE80_9NEIS|nr:succinate dehydrogenase assembly factor 2 [Alysiella filiformis]QMT30957.1 succinate dehydrogenase assembly factor 2 [Alysiella filiformis]UBQ56056.1 succinate dehydrogenase assembly factor 2 [Alysiella filiformis DSM 16848]SOD69215.1 antitoxin CptB [Alysiella filiformis DSM 16848]
MAQFNETDKRRIRFQTRRGLLELDIVLKRFMAKEYDQLSDEELAIFVDILALEDQEFLAIINQYQTPQRADFEPILHKIRTA